MANPQVENGHIDIANEIAEAFARYFPGGSEGQILWAILRKTYGWHKKEDEISIGQLMEMTGLSRRMVIYSLQNLEAKRMIIVKRKKEFNGLNKINSMGLQKNYDKWVVQEKTKQYRNVLKTRKKLYSKNKRGVVQEKGGSARNCKRVVQETVNDEPFLAPTKTTITKTTITKTTLTRENDFEHFWEIYPKKKSKGQARKTWDKLVKQKALPDMAIISNAIAIQINCHDWKKDEGKYIPYPSSWLNAEGWEDEIRQYQNKPKTAPEPQSYAQVKDAEQRSLAKWALRQMEERDEGNHNGRNDDRDSKAQRYLPESTTT